MAASFAEQIGPEGAMTMLKKGGLVSPADCGMDEEKAQDFLKAMAAVDPDSRWEPHRVTQSEIES
jgi:hypothetical protein